MKLVTFEKYSYNLNIIYSNYNTSKLSFLCLILVFFILFFNISINYLINFTNDDSYFYLKTALTFALEGKSSFDGINPTNGYHPLWFLLVSIIYKSCLIFGFSSNEFLLRIIFVATSLINLLTLFFVRKIIKEVNRQPNTFIFIVTFLLLVPFVLFYLVGLEVQVFILTLVILIYLLLKFIKYGLNKFLIIYISCTFSLLFLARVDIFWYVIVSVFIFTVNYKREQLLGMLQTLVIPLLIIIIYVIINKINFQTYYPISSYYKLSFNVLENFRFFPLPQKDPINFALLLLISFFTGIYYLNKTYKKLKNNDVLRLIEWLNIAFLIFLFLNFLINSNGAREWYYSFPMFTSILMFSMTIAGTKYEKLIILSIIIFNIFYFLIFRSYYYNHISAYNFANKIKKLLPEEVKIYQIDYSGLIAFFSGKRIINGDGLINSYEYYEAIKSGKLLDYLQNIKPDYFVFYSFTNPILDDIFLYHFDVLKTYEIRIPTKNLVLIEPFLYGGIFRRKVGNFYLLKLNEFEVIRH
ncbi:MAG: hypothetical protein QXR30_04960 [Candidatus Woesearchaeota archaeon]